MAIDSGRSSATAHPVPFPELIDRYGLLGGAGLGVQIDITAVTRRAEERFVAGYLCDHNCTIMYRGKPTGGHYNCPAAFSANRGAIAASVAPPEVLLSGIDRTIAAGRREQDRFLAEEFDAYARHFRLPPAVAALARQHLDQETVEVALFGGSPETHPGLLDLVTGLRRAGRCVHVTMTGRRVMREPAFLEKLSDAGIDVVALSVDDVDDLAQLHHLLRLSPEELHAQWRKVPPAHGQRQKVYEALYTARTLSDLPSATRPGLLFNIAVHEGNVSTMGRFLEALTAAFPDARLNPFPMQSAFEGRRPDPIGTFAPALWDFVSTVIETHHRRAAGQPVRWNLVPRLHYWLALRVAMEAAGMGDEYTAGERAAGWGTWRCFRSAGSGRYLQIAGIGQAVDGTGYAGGHAGCFWHEALTDPELPPIWEADTTELAHYLKTRPERAHRAPRTCAGCLFPRLVGDMVSLETGLDPALRQPYLTLRKTHLGI